MSTAQQHQKDQGRDRVALTGLLVFALLCLLQLTVGLYLNGGAFSFTLDDPYIHLALAQQLWEHGHYGVNLGEFAAPSSSVIWPFLIAPLSSWPLAILALNLGFASATIVVMARGLKTWRLPLEAPGKTSLQRWLLVGLLVASNQVGLAFLGMEHSLQLLCASLLAYGLLCGARDNILPSWIWPAFVMAPLVRYEMLALDAAVLAFAWTQKQGRVASVVSGGVTVALLGAFSYFLRSLGLAAMPSSIKAKVAASPGAGPLDAVAEQVLRTLTYPQGIIMLLGVVAILALAYRNSARSSGLFKLQAPWSGPKSLGLALVVACLSHFCVGKYGWFYRYEVYVWTFFLLLGGYLVTTAYAQRLEKLFLRVSARRIGLLSVLALAACSFLYLWALIIGPLGSNNIYEQQFQMHRLLKDHYPHPVAVNDLGWVAYRNPNYVLDLWGLGSEQARKARFAADQSSAWMDSLAKSKDVRLAMVYDAWFKELPPSWIKIGTLSLGKMRITPAHADVAFYLMDAAEAPRFCEAAKAWAKDLPSGVVFASECERAQSP